MVRTARRQHEGRDKTQSGRLARWGLETGELAHLLALCLCLAFKLYTVLLHFRLTDYNHVYVVWRLGQRAPEHLETCRRAPQRTTC